MSNLHWFLFMFCFCFFSNSTLKVLEAIVEFDRFCHSKEEPHLLNSYGEGISTDVDARSALRMF